MPDCMRVETILGVVWIEQRQCGLGLTLSYDLHALTMTSALLCLPDTGTSSSGVQPFSCRQLGGRGSRVCSTAACVQQRRPYKQHTKATVCGRQSSRAMRLRCFCSRAAAAGASGQRSWRRSEQLSLCRLLCEHGSSVTGEAVTSLPC
jgi:hypothetical protein